MVGFAQSSQLFFPTAMDAPLVDHETHVRVHRPLRLHPKSSRRLTFVFLLLPFGAHPVWEVIGRLALLAMNSVGSVASVAIHGTGVGDGCGLVQGRPAIDRGRGRGGLISTLWSLAGAIWMPLAVGYHSMGGWSSLVGRPFSKRAESQRLKFRLIRQAVGGKERGCPTPKQSYQ